MTEFKNSPDFEELTEDGKEELSNGFDPEHDKIKKED